MPACEHLDDRAGVHPCTAHRHLPADPVCLQQQAVQYTPEWSLQVISWFRTEGTLVPLCSSNTKYRHQWCLNHLNLSKH